MNGPPPTFATTAVAKGSSSGIIQQHTQQFDGQMSSAAAGPTWGGIPPPRPLAPPPSSQLNAMPNGLTMNAPHGQGQPVSASVPSTQFGHYSPSMAVPTPSVSGSFDHLRMSAPSSFGGPPLPSVPAGGAPATFPGGFARPPLSSEQLPPGPVTMQPALPPPRPPMTGFGLGQLPPASGGQHGFVAGYGSILQPRSDVLQSAGGQPIVSVPPPALKPVAAVQMTMQQQQQHPFPVQQQPQVQHYQQPPSQLLHQHQQPPSQLLHQQQQPPSQQQQQQPPSQLLQQHQQPSSQLLQQHQQPPSQLQQQQPPAMQQPQPPALQQQQPSSGLPTGAGPQQSSTGGVAPLPTHMSPAVSASLAMPRVPSGSELLPRPFHGQGQYSHMKHVGLPNSRSITPVNPDTPSPRSSRVPSPVPSQQFDNLEGQFNNSPASTPRESYPPSVQNAAVGVASRLPSTQDPMTNRLPASTLPPPPHGQFPPMSSRLTAMPHGSASTAPTYLPPTSQSIQAGYPPTFAASGMQPPAATPSSVPGGFQQQAFGATGMPPPVAGFAGMSLNAVPPELRTYNLLQEKTLLPPEGVTAPSPNLVEGLKRVNCSSELFRCTLTSLPQTSQILSKARLPLGILIHPFKDLSSLSVVQANVIVRCRACRTYINPFVTFIDQRRWRCNLCQRANELPDDFNYDPVSKTYGHPDRRPELKYATIEYIAPSEYMLRPPQPAVYLFLLDVSRQAIETGYLYSFCKTVTAELDRLPGDGRTTIGFIAYNSRVHFFSLLSEHRSAPHMMTVSDIDDIFIPCPEGLLVNLSENRGMIEQLLMQLPTLFNDGDAGSALGAALQTAIKLMHATGGRVSVMQATLPNVGAGMLSSRESASTSSGGASEKPENLGPANDFYKRLALEAAGQQIAVDVFFLNNQYLDIATISGIAKHCGGCIHSYPGLHSQRNPGEVERFERDLTRYLTRKIGFEAVMRVRCTKGLSMHTFHGNFFVRSTDLLALPNVNPDAGFGMQVSIEEPLTEVSTASFQAALLYTSSKGERRIRVHTLCLPITNSVNDVITGADQQAIAGLLAKMAVDRSLSAGVGEAREALVNAAVDALTAFGATLAPAQRVGVLPCPYSLRLLPLYIVALMKSVAFRLGSAGPRLDARVFAMEQCKSLPLARLMLMLHPDLYPVHALTDEGGLLRDEDVIPQPPRLSLSSANIDRHGAFLLDVGDFFYLYIGAAISDAFCRDVLGCPNFQSVPEGLHELPALENATSSRMRLFFSYLRDGRTNYCPLKVIREDSMNRPLFMQHMIEDKSENATSYYEFLQYLQKQAKP